MSFFGKFYFSTSQHLPQDSEEAMHELMRMRGSGSVGRGPILPPTDVYESDEAYVVWIELAGVRPEDIEVHLTGAVLTVRGQRREVCPHCKRSYLQMEIEYGPFMRQLSFPGSIDAERATASFKDGMLEIVLPKGAASRTREEALTLHVEWSIVQQ